MTKEAKNGDEIKILEDIYVAVDAHNYGSSTVVSDVHSYKMFMWTYIEWRVRVHEY